MPLTLTLRNATTIPVEVDSIQLETVREQSPDDVLRTPVQYGNKELPLGEFFDAAGSAGELAGDANSSTDGGEIVWRGDCSKIKLIGTGLSFGRVRVEGNAGMHVGAEMSGGEIIVEGDAGDWVGAEMKGGRIHVKGNAGHLVGAVYRGGRRGMTGGEVLIDGNAGNEIGHTMRRGLIAVGGRSGDAAGFNMIAGTVLLFGEAGIRPGAGMRRGTIAYFDADQAPDVLPTFKYACTWRPEFMRFCLLHLKARGFDAPDGCIDSAYRRYFGDFLEYGKGEILVRDAR